MQALGKFCGIVFGTVMIVLSLVVTVETIIRKVFSVLLGGVDELSGYAIAVGACRTQGYQVVMLVGARIVCVAVGLCLGKCELQARHTQDHRRNQQPVHESHRVVRACEA